MLDNLIKCKIKELGHLKASKFFINPKTDKPVTVKTIHNWVNGTSGTPTWAAELILKEKGYGALSNNPVQLEELEWEGKKLIIGIPSYRTTNPHYLYCLLCLQDIHLGKIGFDIVTQTVIEQARNIIASKFMKTGAEWLLFLDDDMVFPCGRSAVHYDRWGSGIPDSYAGLDIISRLMSHGKPLIGGLYYGRHREGRAQYAEAFNNDKENKWAHGAPYDEIKPTRWVATGAMLIHKSVFEAIEKKFPELLFDGKGKANGYFTPLGPNCGEDMSFCTRAFETGIQPYVDMGCICGHLGAEFFWAHNTI